MALPTREDFQRLETAIGALAARLDWLSWRSTDSRPVSPEPAVTGPPWVIVIHLPDDVPPIDAITRAFAAAVPTGSRVTALAADPARAVLAAIPAPERP